MKKQTKARPPQDNQLTSERRKEIEAAYARREVDFLRQAFAGNNKGVSECAERFLEKALEEIRSERDRTDAFQLKKNSPPSGELEETDANRQTKVES